MNNNDNTAILNEIFLKSSQTTRSSSDIEMNPANCSGRCSIGVCRTVI